MFLKQRDQGFTLIELLIVISISVVLASAAAPLYSNFQVSAQLNESSAQIIQAVRTARIRALSGYNSSDHGVKIESDKFIIYQGPSYALRSSSFDRAFLLEGALSLSSSLAGGEINFKANTAQADNSGQIIISHLSGKAKTVGINALGLAEAE